MTAAVAPMRTETAGAPLVTCRGLTVEYRARGAGRRSTAIVRALRGVDLEIRPGETVGVVGESGSGKSTLARAIVGQARLTAGSVEHAFGDGDARALAARLAMVFQDPKSSLNPRLSIRSIVADPLVVHRRGDRAERARRVDELLADVGLPAALRDRRARQLSGGQLQRVAIARALALDPQLIVADEPTSALDVSVQAQVVNLLRRLKAERRFAMLIVSHDMGVIHALADRVVVMYDGLVVEEGPVDEVYERPRHPYTLTLLASATSVSGATRGEETHVDHLLGLPRPHAGTETVQADRCPFADRCWRAREACLEEVPATVGDAHRSRCVAPLDGPARAQALGTGDAREGPA